MALLTLQERSESNGASDDSGTQEETTDGGTGMKLILQTANIVGDEKNCLYPNRAEVTSAEELQEAVKMDHVCAEYDNDYRSKENFGSGGLPWR